jgi:hypothetical protein
MLEQTKGENEGFDIEAYAVHQNKELRPTCVEPGCNNLARKGLLVYQCC